MQVLEARSPANGLRARGERRVEAGDDERVRRRRVLGRISTSSGSLASLPMKHEDRNQCRQSGDDLQDHDGNSLSGLSRNPLDREEQGDRNLASHEELPNVGRCTLVLLGRRTMEGKKKQHHRERAE